jgi:hypothetical protein
MVSFRFFGFLVLTFCLTLKTFAQPEIYQSLSANKSGWGKVTLLQESRIEGIVSKHIEINQKAKGFPGFRVQVYFGSGSDAKSIANKIRSELNNQYPNLDSYLIYEAPYFKVRVGDFRNRNEAYKAYKMVQDKYPGAFVVDDLIGMPRFY